MIESLLIGVSLGIIALITSVGNLIVLCAFYNDHKLRTMNDYLILNMAIADFLVGFICIPFYIPSSIKQSWPFGRLFCQIWVTIDDVSTMASVINIVAISLNRYWSIGYPISYRRYAKKTFLYCSMGFIWLISFINFAPGIWLINFNNKTEIERNDCVGDYNQSFIYMLIAQFNYFIWPFCLLCLLNLLIIRNIWKRTKKMSHCNSFHHHHRHHSSSKYSWEKTNPSYSIKEQDRLTYLTTPLEENNFIKKSFQPIEQINSTRKLKTFTRRSAPTGIKSNSNGRISRNIRSDSMIEYHLTSQISYLNKHICGSIKQRDLRITRDRKAARSLFILVLLFLLFLFPYVICSIALTAGVNISSRIYQISFGLLWMNSTINPFLYPFIQIKYRKAYWKLFQKFFSY